MSLNPRPMTPTQAKDFICCGPHHHSTAIHGMCIGPACMAWRWADGGHVPAVVDAKGKEESPAHDKPPTKGTCGYIGE